MTTLSIQPPYPLITDIDGQPLEDGYIWIGAANLPPIGNPIAVYWDAALTQPAALPVRTRGGYPVNAGTPARLYVGSDYSILVQNKNGSTLYSAPDGASDRFSAAQISFLQAGSGAVVRTAQSKMRDVVSVLDFGADPTGGTDSTGAIQAAMDVFASSNREGGTVYFPHGKYLVTGTLVPKSENIRLVGDGKRNPQNLIVESDTDVPATLLKTGVGALIRIDTQYRCNGFRTRDITLLGAAADKANITGVEWFINGPNFRRDFAFEETTVSRFNDAFLVNRDSGATESAIGVVRIVLCSVMANEYIWRHTGSTNQVNGFVFEKCDAGQNGYTTGGGIYGLRAQDITIADNILEGQRDPILITGGFRGIRIQNNYFEANVGEACVDLQDTQQGIIGPNIYISVSTAYKVRMRRCVGFTILDPAWQEGSILCFDGQYTSSSFLSSGGEYIITAPTGIVLAWRKLDKASFARMNKPSSYVIGQFLPGTICREKWIDGTVVAAGETAATSGYLFSETFSLTAAANQFLVASFALRFTDETADIYAALRVNGSSSSAGGSWETTFISSRYAPTGEWIIVTFACRALVAVTSLEVYLFPFGTSHTGTKTFRGLRGIAYVCDDPSQIRPFVDIDDAAQVFNPPSAGTWVRGDKLWDVTPTAGQAPGWVCTTAGTPGTWKAMADLAP